MKSIEELQADLKQLYAELEERKISNIELLEDISLFTELNIISKKKCTIDKINELTNAYIFDYQKGDVYEYEY